MSSTNFDPKKSITFYYKIESVTMILPNNNKVTIEPTKVESFALIKDFTNNYLPIFRLSTMLSSYQVYNIINNKDTVRFHIRITEYKYDYEKNILKKQSFIDDLFCTIIEEETPNLDKKIIENAKNTSDSIGTESLNDFGSYMELYLFRESDLNAIKNVNNVVISNSNMLTVCTYLLSSAGVKKMLMTPLNNTRSYSQILIPPYTLVGALRFLEQNYGFYHTYSTIFFDYDTGYMLSHKMPCNTFRRGEVKRMSLYIGADDSSQTFYSGLIEKSDNDILINITKNAASFTNSSLTKDQIQGTDVLTIDQTTGAINRNTSKSSNVGNRGVQVLVNKYNNPFMVSAEAYRTNESAISLSCNIKMCSVNHFTPNKEYNVILEDSQANKMYKGVYRLSYATHTFTRKGEEFEVSTIANFSRYTN